MPAEMESLGIESTEPKSLRWLATDGISRETTRNWREPSVGPETWPSSVHFRVHVTLKSDSIESC